MGSKITKEIWKEFETILSKYHIPCTCHFEEHNGVADKHCQINVVIPDYYEEKVTE